MTIVCDLLLLAVAAPSFVLRYRFALEGAFHRASSGPAHVLLFSAGPQC
jgi:hypothetical protein